MKNKKYLIFLLSLVSLYSVGTAGAADGVCVQSLGEFAADYFENPESNNFVCDLGNNKSLQYDGAILAMNNNEDAAPLVVSVPHPFFEDGTWQQGVYAFEELNVRAVIFSGQHRCASFEYSICDGRTSVCDGKRMPFRASDAAHNVGAFHEHHSDLLEHYPDDTFVSLHGIGDDFFVTSNGTKDPIEQGQLVDFNTSLRDLFGAERVSTCNADGQTNLVDHHCGTTNLQGRLLNGSENACFDSADFALDNFIHLEQPRNIRMSEVDSRAVMDELVNIVQPEPALFDININTYYYDFAKHYPEWFWPWNVIK
jgi:hypothetical protein